MKKKLFAVLICMLTLAALCSLFAFAEDAGSAEALVWDFWSLLKPENVNYAQVLAIMVTTLVTVIRMLTGSGMKDLGAQLLAALKNLIPSK